MKLLQECLDITANYFPRRFDECKVKTIRTRTFITISFLHHTPHLLIREAPYKTHIS
ncbi:hypothetical protein A2U01_0067583, partial [Trifolium medium]|nr:hypothetical protein [Trifolium medium]